MDNINFNDYLILSLLLIVWCSLHSAMISVRVTQYLQKHHADKYRFYRLFFNLVALITLTPIAIYAFSLQSENLFDWQGWFRIPQIIFLGMGVWLFFLGTTKYDAKRFFGLTQIKETGSGQAITASGKLDTSGILGAIRHPWYTSLLLILWARPLDMSALTVNLVFTAYLLVGVRLEENKLIREFGDDYHQYQQRVSMLIPFKWLKARLGANLD